MNELEKYNVIKELVDHNWNKRRATERLSLSQDYKFRQMQFSSLQIPNNIIK